MKALEILLSRRWILKSREKELYYQLKDELGEVKKFLMEKMGYQVIVNPMLVKAEKVPAEPENWMGILEFKDIRDYVYFCCVLMFLEDKEPEEQFVLSELTEYVQGQNQEMDTDWTVYHHRRSLGMRRDLQKTRTARFYMKIQECPNILPGISPEILWNIRDRRIF